MNDDEVFDVQRREELRLIKMFLGIKDAARRQRILALAEQLADDAASGIPGPAVGLNGPSREDASQEAHGPT
ncbi:hypothetical protein JQ554_10050 [Bradyrhizobium diazoefficiens]|jgi:hypothetical protein|nr:hypothetical protein [Bradyrhizobium diazoefficiens]MBR0965138.1 hypothetical protein [Bradyrhizobium diazoefficiens]MBR0977535.1 hypothetical protein [Bradyrhizobium diazoefficiens]MBR1007783.1 hypothetical protein [Bradyrhizobium diazoefficiens]MBR1013600.1 hypothetical protein [Bradyrhizobium diazoefficiens]MBR1050692.1 hypothetical protein [Bradyrhizobium diazoefficiens]